MIRAVSLEVRLLSVKMSKKVYFWEMSQFVHLIRHKIMRAWNVVQSGRFQCARSLNNAFKVFIMCPDIGPIIGVQKVWERLN